MLGQSILSEHPACFSVWEQPGHASTITIIIYSWGYCIPSSFNVTMCTRLNIPRDKENMFNYFIALFYSIHHVSPGIENSPKNPQIRWILWSSNWEQNPKYAFGLWLNMFEWKIIVFFILSLFYVIFKLIMYEILLQWDMVMTFWERNSVEIPGFSWGDISCEIIPPFI